ELHALVRRRPGPRPRGVVLVVRRGGAEGVEAPELLQGCEVLLDRRRDAVLGQELADRAVLPLAGRPVVAPDVDDDRALAVPEPLDLVEEPARLHVGVLAEARRDLHAPRLQRLLV